MHERMPLADRAKTIFEQLPLSKLYINKLATTKTNIEDEEYEIRHLDLENERKKEDHSVNRANTHFE